MLETNTEQNVLDTESYLKHLLSIKERYTVTRASTIHGFVPEKVPVAIAYRPNAKILSQSGGKGITVTQALISALMESFECHSAEEVDWESECSYVDLQGDKISPRNLAITTLDFSEYDTAKWVSFTEISRGGQYWAPFDAVSLDFRRMVSLHKRETYFMTSNGLASGSSWENAIMSGIYEVIERHSMTTNELSGTDRSRPINAKSIANEQILHLVKEIEAHGLEVRLYDNTLWQKFPTYKAIVCSPFRQWTGFGTHLNPIVAALRAITEANQARVISISGTREDMNKDFYLSTTHVDAFPQSPESANDLFASTINPNISFDDFIELVSLETQTRWFIYRYKQIDERVFVVRVIAEYLHGYNYPGYSSSVILDKPERTLQRESMIKRQQHSPAAG